MEAPSAPASSFNARGGTWWVLIWLLIHPWHLPFIFPKSTSLCLALKQLGAFYVILSLEARREMLVDSPMTFPSFIKYKQSGKCSFCLSWWVLSVWISTPQMVLTIARRVVSCHIALYKPQWTETPVSLESYNMAASGTPGMLKCFQWQEYDEINSEILKENQQWFEFFFVFLFL